MKISVPRDDWVELPLSEFIWNNIVFIIRWSFLFGTSAYIIGYVWSQIFIEFAPKICDIVK